jgi:hypothetical protein
MPEISRFLGVVILMHFREHNPPHFHARYNEFEAALLIDTLPSWTVTCRPGY